MEKDQLVLRNISKTSKTFHNYVRCECEKIGINFGYQGIIMKLGKQNGQSQLDLSKGLMLSAPTVSLTLQKMEYEGYIERKQDDVDARITRVYLTDKGFEMDEKIRQIFKKVEMMVEEALPKNKQDELFEMLDIINAKLAELSK